MRTTYRSRARDVLIAMVAVPFCLALLLPAPAAAAGSGDPEPASTSESAEPADASAPDPEPSTDEPGDEPTEDATEELVDEPTDGPDAEEPGETVPTGPVDDEAPATGEPLGGGDVAEPAPATPVTLGEQAVAAPEPRVTICHRTNDRTNPYNQISVTISQAAGHAAEHTGPIFTPGGPRPWGDIIPPIPPLPNGQNWPEGRPILDNGCEVEPDPGPLPSATIGEVMCVGATPSLQVTVSNDPDATASATFTIFVDGGLVQTVGPVAPGGSETVTLTGAGFAARENQTFTVEVRSGGDVIASEVVSVDCDPPPPPGVEIVAQLDCVAGGAVGTLEATNNGPNPVTVTVTVNGAPFGNPLVVGPGATETSTADVSQFEDQTIVVQVFVDGQPVATYTPTPDCELTPVPRVSVAGLECPPPSATATLSNDGDPESTVVFTILVDGRVVQQTAPLFGGDTTTIVGDLTPFEDQTVTIELRANGEVLGSRTLAVDCRQPAPGPGPGTGPGGAGPGGLGPAQAGSAENDVLPATGAPFNVGLVATGLGLVTAGAFLIIRRPTGTRSAR